MWELTVKMGLGNSSCDFMYFLLLTIFILDSFNLSVLSVSASYCILSFKLFQHNAQSLFFF